MRSAGTAGSAQRDLSDGLGWTRDWPGDRPPRQRPEGRRQQQGQCQDIELRRGRGQQETYAEVSEDTSETNLAKMRTPLSMIGPAAQAALARPAGPVVSLEALA